MSATRALMNFHDGKRWNVCRDELKIGPTGVALIKVLIGNYYVEHRQDLGLRVFPLDAATLGPEQGKMLSVLVFREAAAPNEVYLLSIRIGDISPQELEKARQLFGSRSGGQP